MIVGHEPAWSAAASLLANGATFRLPTASLLRLAFDADDRAAVRGNGSAQWLAAPGLLGKLLSPARAGPLRARAGPSSSA